MMTEREWQLKREEIELRRCQLREECANHRCKQIRAELDQAQVYAALARADKEEVLLNIEFKKQ